MKNLMFGIAVLGALAASADAALVCASPQEMKVLQSAALQQQLMVAALTCHKSADYNLFVNSFRGQLIKSDDALKAFFAGRPRGENYNAYKTRVANAASLRSLRDARFCDSAQKVFDLALGRGEERRGLAPEPPQLIDTGYEGCRPVEDKLITVQAAPAPVVTPTPKPAETRVAGLQIAKPPIVPAAKPVLNAVDQRALALVPKAAPTAPVRVAALPPLGQVRPAAAHVPVVAAPVRKFPQPVAQLAAAEPIRKAPPVAHPQTVRAEGSAERETRRDVGEPRRYADEPQRYADEEPQRDSDDPQRYADEDPQRDADETQRYADEEPRRYADEPQRYAAVERPQWRRVDQDRAGYRQDRDEDDDLTADDNIPNAYRPGSAWVDNAGPAWHPAGYYPPPPRWARTHHRSYLVRAPDGRWIVVIGRQPRWVRD